MAVKRSGYKRSTKRKSFFEAFIENFLNYCKKLVFPALVIWFIGWLWLGGLIAKGSDYVWDGFVQWTATQGLQVQDVTVTGRFRTDMSVLQDAVDISLGSPILDVDVDKIQNRIEDLPWVKSAMVGRNYNGIVTVALIERVPFVLWDRPGRNLALVDTVGEIIKTSDTNDYSTLLIVSGVDAPKYTVMMMQNLLAEPEVAEFVKSAQWIGDRRWDLMTYTGTRIHMPEDDIGYALTRLAVLQREKNILERGLLSIDLRGRDRIIIETERGEAHDAINLSNITETNTI